MRVLMQLFENKETGEIAIGCSRLTFYFDSWCAKIIFNATIEF